MKLQNAFFCYPFLYLVFLCGVGLWLLLVKGRLVRRGHALVMKRCYVKTPTVHPDLIQYVLSAIVYHGVSLCLMSSCCCSAMQNLREAIAGYRGRLMHEGNDVKRNALLQVTPPSL